MAPLDFLFFQMSALSRTHGGWLDVALVGHSPSRRLFSSPHRLSPYTVSPAFKYTTIVAHIRVIPVKRSYLLLLCKTQAKSVISKGFHAIWRFVWGENFNYTDLAHDEVGHANSQRKLWKGLHKLLILTMELFWSGIWERGLNCRMSFAGLLTRQQTRQRDGRRGGGNSPNSRQGTMHNNRQAERAAAETSPRWQ